jgi:hypothetical protein
LRDIAPPLGCHCAATSVGGFMFVRFAAEILSDLGPPYEPYSSNSAESLGPALSGCRRCGTAKARCGTEKLCI